MVKHPYRMKIKCIKNRRREIKIKLKIKLKEDFVEKLFKT